MSFRAFSSDELVEIIACPFSAVHERELELAPNADLQVVLGNIPPSLEEWSSCCIGDVTVAGVIGAEADLDLFLVAGDSSDAHFRILSVFLGIGALNKNTRCFSLMAAGLTFNASFGRTEILLAPQGLSWNDLL